VFASTIGPIKTRKNDFSHQMNLVQFALRRPYTVLVLVLGLLIGSGLALHSMARDIFPSLGVPTIYVAQPYAAWTRRRWKAS